MQYAEYILLCMLFYLIGSVPTAYIILKFSHQKNITEEGSGNVGALNSYEVTKSKITGLSVLFIDFLKGFIPAFLFIRFAGFSIETMTIPLSLIIAGHNFSFWIKFKGGRGLATAAGIALVAEPWILIIWCAVFLISFGIYRNVHFGNISATILLPVIYYIINNAIPGSISGDNSLLILVIIISLLILIKHINPMLELIQKFKYGN